MILTKDQTMGWYEGLNKAPKPKRMRSWRIARLIVDMDAELARVLPQWEREVKSMLPVERKPVDSLSYMKLIREDPELTKTTLLVAFLYAVHADTSTGENTYPSDAALAKEGGISTRQIVTSRKTLVRLGYLEWTGRYINRNGIKVYRLTAPVQPVHRGYEVAA